MLKDHARTKVLRLDEAIVSMGRMRRRGSLFGRLRQWRDLVFVSPMRIGIGLVQK